MLKPQVYVILIPSVLGLVYMILHEDLSMTGWILAGCLAFGAAMMFVVYKISEAKLKEDGPNSKDKVDRSAFKVVQSEPLSTITARLAGEQPKGYVAVAQYLRETVHKDSIAAIETVKVGVIQHSLTRLLTGNTDPNSAVALLELLNEVLANKQAKANLTADVDALHTAVDAALHWVAILASNLIRALQLPAETIPLTGVQLTGRADVNSLSQAQAVAFAAGEGLNGRTEQLIALTNKALVCVGLLCSDDCPDAQTRLTDRGGAKVLLGVLAIAVAMCNTTTASAGIGASGSNNSNGGVLNKEQRRKLSAGLCKWACWCLFNMSLEHPPAKSVLYHCQAIATTVDALKLHPDSAHVHRQGLALLFNLIAPDLYAKYSLAHARQSMLANGIVDVVEHAKVAFKKERDIVTTCRAISNTMMVDFS